MPKVKTNSSAKKRFKLTQSGKLKHKRAFKRHNLSKRTTKAKRMLRPSGLVSVADHAKVENMLNL